MSRSTFPPPSRTKAQPASNVSPLHHSGSTAMTAVLPFEADLMDASLYALYQNLRATSPSVGQMVQALNIALNQYGWGIFTIADLECFVDAADAWEAENE